jgi:hypothetical protein
MNEWEEKCRLPIKSRPKKIFQTATGFMGAKFLFAANEIGLSEALAGGPPGLEEIAQRTDSTLANSKLRKEFVDIPVGDVKLHT